MRSTRNSGNGLKKHAQMIKSKNNLLYLAPNDGSDMRITKEIQTLSKKYNVTYIGIGTDKGISFAKQYSYSFILVRGKRKNIITNTARTYRKTRRYSKRSSVFSTR